MLVLLPVGEPFTVYAHAAVGGGMNTRRRSAFNAAKAGNKRWKVQKEGSLARQSSHKSSV